MSLIITFLAIFSLIIVYLVYVRVRHMSKLARNGIPGPKPNLIFGYFSEIKSVPTIEWQRKLIEKYGKVVAFYFGAKPCVLIADPDLAKNIQIKDFHQFTDRPKVFLKHGLEGIPAMSTSLIRREGKRWKEMRSALTPTFSGSKLRTMTPIIEDSINNFINLIEKHSKSEDEFDIYDMFQNLTTDVIGRTAFGIQSNVQNESNNKFLIAAKHIFNIKISQIIIVITMCFPSLDLILHPYRRLQTMVKHWFGKSPNSILLDMVRDIIQLRKQNPNYRRKDLLQLMLDTKISGEDVSAMTDESLTAGNSDNESNSNEVKQNGVKNGKSKQINKSIIKLTDDEIKSNAVLFFEAGYETTSTALGFMAHILVNYPEVQEKIREEVKQLYESDGKLDFNTVNKLEFMECVLNETMRVYPPVISFVTRNTLEDYKYKDMTIPKGTQIQIATHYLHHDPDYWPQPEVFDPMRFSADRKHSIHPSSWQPFGSGPRNCIGMRFALFEAKLALAKLVLNYRLEPTPKTEIGDLTTECKFITLCPKNGVFVKAVKL